MNPTDYLKARLEVLKMERYEGPGPISERDIKRHGAIAELEHVLLALKALS